MPTREKTQTVLLAVISLFLLPVLAAGQESGEKEQGEGEVTVEVAFGWTAIRGNDVQIGDRTTVGRFGRFDSDTSFEPVVTSMDGAGMPLVRLGYEGRTWGVGASLWRLETSGSTDGSFDNARSERPEILRMWSDWHGEFEGETSFSAENALSLFSGRIDLTHSLTSDVLLSLGLQIAKFENDRSESVDTSQRIRTQEKSGQSRVAGWLLGPAFGIQGSASAGRVVTLGFSFSQSFLFADLDDEASWDYVAAFEPIPIHAETAFSSNVAVPATEAHASLRFAAGGHVSIGVIVFLSAWYDMPTASEFSFPFERWEERRRTLIFASAGPVVTLRF